MYQDKVNRWSPSPQKQPKRLKYLKHPPEAIGSRVFTIIYMIYIYIWDIWDHLGRFNQVSHTAPWWPKVLDYLSPSTLATLWLDMTWWGMSAMAKNHITLW